MLVPFGMTDPSPQPRMPLQVHVHDSFSRVLDARREGLRRLQQRLLRRALALGVASSSDQLRDSRARLRQRHTRLDAGAARAARRGDDTGRVAVPLEDRDRLLLQLGLAAQTSRERKERDEETGDHASRFAFHPLRAYGSRESCVDAANGAGGGKKSPPSPGKGEGGGKGVLPPSPLERTACWGE